MTVVVWLMSESLFFDLYMCWCSGSSSQSFYQESDAKRLKQMKKPAPAPPIVNDTVVKESVVEAVPKAAVSQAEITQKDPSKGVRQNGIETQTKHDVQLQQKEEKALAKDMPDAGKVVSLLVVEMNVELTAGLLHVLRTDRNCKGMDVCTCCMQTAHYQTNY